MTMKRFHYLSSLLLLTIFFPLLAHETTKQAAPMSVNRVDNSGAILNLAPTAKDAVACVDRFSAAILRGDMSAVEAELDAQVLVLESGYAERSREEYLREHAGEDAKFLASAKIKLLRRGAQSTGDLAWVTSESEITSHEKNSDVHSLSSETMVLKKGPSGWKIVHIHWSSHTQS
jgi:ketosteroid isomerase-like protein